MEVRDLAYAAALVDTLGALTLRDVGPSQLPVVTLQGRFTEALAWLGEQTGTKIIVLQREFMRSGCTHHCPEPHVHIRSSSGRWQISGAKATIVLHNLLPYLRTQDETARTLIEAGRSIGYKGQVVQAMAAKGWDIPELKNQPRARIALERP